MEKETTSSYGYILITVAAIVLLVVIAAPIANKTMGHSVQQTGQLIDNVGIIKDDVQDSEFCTIMVNFYINGSAESFDSTKTVIRKGENYTVAAPDVRGYTPSVMKENGNELEGFVVFTKTLEQETIENKFNNLRTINVYYTPLIYHIEYVDTGVDLNGTITQSYRYGDVVELPTASKEGGYTFLGWCENKDLGGKIIHKIDATNAGDKCLYPKFVKN